MKIKELIQRVRKTEKNEDYVNIDGLAFEFGIMDAGSPQHTPRIKCYWVANHICTDTWVGHRVYFLDDVPVCTSSQSCRKGDETFFWLSREHAREVREYIVSLMVEEEDPLDNINIADTELEMGEGYFIEYTGQMLVNDVLFKGELVKVVEDIHYINGKYNFHNIKIETKEGVSLTVDVRDVLIPWYID